MPINSVVPEERERLLLILHSFLRAELAVKRLEECLLANPMFPVSRYHKLLLERHRR